MPVWSLGETVRSESSPFWMAFRRGRIQLIEGNVRIARIMSLYSAGYQTAVVGKWSQRSLQLCAMEELDLVSVVTPEARHLDPTLTALACEKHVFLEKPIATSMEDAKQIVSAAEASSKFLMVGQILRFENKYASVKKTIDEGRLGKVLSIHARRHRPRQLYRLYGDRVHLMLENSIHDIDICLWYTKDRVRSVRAFTRNSQGLTYPDINWGFLEFENGSVACVETHWIIPDESGVMNNDAMQIIGSDGIAGIDFVPSGLSYWTSSGHQIVNTSYDAFLPSGIQGAIQQEIGYFLKCLLKEEEPSVIRPREAAEALRVTLALVESAEAGEDITLD